MDVKSHTYGNSEWKDLLTEYNGKTITCDETGNPLNYRNNMKFGRSDGRRLSGVTKCENSISYTYNSGGLRTSKTVNGAATEYYWLNGNLQGQNTGSEYIIYLHDENGNAYRFLLKNGASEEYYYYIFNAQGYVIGILDSMCAQVVEYSYNEWGSLSATVGQKNPLRYRCYYYDSETGLYYVSSRYYDPEVGRWISPEPNVDYGEFDEDAGLIGYNVYAYCANNPANNFDPDGEAVANIVGGVVGGVAGAALGVLLAKRLRLTGWKKWALISAATVGGAALGAFLGPYVAKLAKSIRTTVKVGVKQVVKYRKFTENANKVHHFFGKSQHKFGRLLRKFGGNERKAFDAIYKATFNQVKKKGLSGAFETIVKVCGQNVTVRGTVINGVVRIGTGFIR